MDEKNEITFTFIFNYVLCFRATICFPTQRIKYYRENNLKMLIKVISSAERISMFIKNKMNEGPVSEK